MILKATYVKTIYETVKDGVIIALYHTGEKAVTITGTMLPTTENVKYSFEGEWVNHKRFGLQFKAEYFTEDISDEEGIIRFLSSKLIKGIGKSTAEKIVAAFGVDTINILDEDIEKVLTIKRFPKSKFKEFKESYQTQRGAKEVILALGKVGVGVKLALAACERFKDNIREVIEKTPYKLSEISGISFPTADRLGNKTYEYEHSYGRFKACARYCLSANEYGGMYKLTGNMSSGSNGMQKDEFGKAMLDLLYINTIDGKFICDMTIRMLNEKELVYVKKGEDIYFYPVGLFNIERETAKNLSKIMLQPNLSKINVDKELVNTTFSDDQIKAIKNAFNHNISLIVGMPGTGKTTIINKIAEIYHKENPKNEMYFLAPTGRASARIRETLSIDASVSTIHIALKIDADEINDLEQKEVLFN